MIPVAVSVLLANKNHVITPMIHLRAQLSWLFDC